MQSIFFFRLSSFSSPSTLILSLRATYCPPYPLFSEGRGVTTMGVWTRVQLLASSPPRFPSVSVPTAHAHAHMHTHTPSPRRLHEATIEWEGIDAKGWGLSPWVKQCFGLGGLGAEHLRFNHRTLQECRSLVGTGSRQQFVYLSKRAWSWKDKDPHVEAGRRSKVVDASTALRPDVGQRDG